MTFLVTKQKDRRKFWGKVVEIGADILTVAVNVVVMVWVPGSGAVGGLTPALWIIKKLMKGDQRGAQKALLPP